MKLTLCRIQHRQQSLSFQMMLVSYLHLLPHPTHHLRVYLLLLVLYTLWLYFCHCVINSLHTCEPFEAYGMPCARAGMGSRAAQFIGLPRRSKLQDDRWFFLRNVLHERTKKQTNRQPNKQASKQSNNQTINQSINLSIKQSINQSILTN